MNEAALNMADKNIHAASVRLALEFEQPPSLPPLELLQTPDPAAQPQIQTDDLLEQNAKALENVLRDFGVDGQVTKVSPGQVTGFGPLV